LSQGGSYTASLVKPENDSVVFQWSDIMLQAVRDLSLSPVEATRGFAMAHVAGSVAVGNPLPRFKQIAPIENIDSEIAYVVAFSLALEEAWSVSFGFQRRAYLHKRQAARYKDESVRWGRQVAALVTDSRIRDGAEPARAKYYPLALTKASIVSDASIDNSMGWHPTGPFYGARSGPGFDTFERGQLPGWGWQKPWLISNLDQYQPEPFPHHRSPEFIAQFAKVKALGGALGADRSAQQSQIALFWEDGPNGISNPGHFQLLAVDVVQRQSWSVRDQAQFFAVLSLAQADAAIVAWRSKYQTNILRPETAIRFAHSRFPDNPDIHADPGWNSYIPTPAFPSYVSGHSVFGAVSAKLMALMLGSDRIHLKSKVPDQINWPKQLKGVSRSWTNLTALAEENGMSREYGGVHWESDNQQGLVMGYALAKEVFETIRPEFPA